MSRQYRMVKPRFWFLLIALLGITCASVYSSQQQYINRQKEAIAALEAERDAIIEENAVLQRKIEFTYTDEFIEREARKRGLVKEGEILFESND